MNFLLINKPPDWTSFDVVNFIRKKIKTKAVLNSPLTGGISKRIKVGHAGTLDPFATGLLIVGIGREATKRLDEFKNLPKTYVATLHLGAVSDTYDKTGRIEEVRIKNEKLRINHNNKTIEQWDSITPPSRAEIESVLNYFVGKQSQIPPMFSAKKINGVRLYKLARQGKTIERPPCEIEIYDIRIKGYEYPILKIEVECSTGTYIRSLAHDIGQKLGVGAYCEELVRTKIGDYTLDQTQSIDPVEAAP